MTLIMFWRIGISLPWIINIVVGGEVVTLRSMEESLGLIVAEVPINVSLLSLHALLSLDWKT